MEQQRQKARDGQGEGQRAHSGKKISEEITAQIAPKLIPDKNITDSRCLDHPKKD